MGRIPTAGDEWDVDGRKPRQERVVLEDRQATRLTYSSERQGFSVTATVYDDADDLVELIAYAGTIDAPDRDVIGWRIVPRSRAKEAVRVGLGQIRAFLIDGTYADTIRPTSVDT
jgi:hypothetical protein